MQATLPTNPPARTRRDAWRERWTPLAAGIVASCVIAAVAVAVGPFVPLLGSAVVAILLGIVVRSSQRVPRVAAEGSVEVGHLGLKLAIIMLGASVNLVYVGQVAGGSLIVMLGTLTIALLGLWQIGRVLGIAPRLRSLLTAGTSICGASAIAAVAPAVEASGGEMSYAVSVIFLFNIAAVIVFPVLGHLLGFSPHTFAVWAGTAVNDTSSVLATGYAFGSGTASYAAVVKLSRTVMILPVTMGLALLAQRWQTPASRAASSEELVARVHPLRVLQRSLPWFVVIFALASAAYTVHLWPASVAHRAGSAAQYLTILALAAVGLSTDLRDVVRAGHRPILMGFLGWLLVALSSLALQGLVSVL